MASDPLLAALEAVPSVPTALSSVVRDTASVEELDRARIGVALRDEPLGVTFYLLASDERTQWAADELARAFVWPTFARARRPTAHLKPGDPFSDDILTLTRG